MRSFFKNRQNTLLTLLVIAVVVYLVVDIAYRVVEMNAPPPEPQQQAAAVPPAAGAAKDPLEAYGVIVERNLFRTTDKPIVVDQSDPNSLEATNLPLELHGTIAGEDGKGYAIIEERDKKRQRLYKIGDSVAGAAIVRIARNAVVLRVGDREQVLKKKEIAMRGGNRTPMAFPASPTPAARPSARPSTGGAAGPAGDLASLLTQARVTPNVTAGSPGKADGVIINEIQAGSLFETVGLVNGDIIQEVNGRAVTGVADLVSMYRELKPGTSIAVKVTRSGRQVMLNHVVE